MTISNRLKEIQKKFNLNQSQLAELIEAKQNTVSRWINGATTPSTQALFTIATKLNINYDWLITGEGEMGESNVKFTAMPTDFVDIPFKGDIFAAAGTGCWVTNETPTEFYPIPRKWLEEVEANIPMCDVINVSGDSMFPTLNDRDKILVDRSKLEIINNKIYIINLNNELYVKKLFKDLDGSIALKSDNPDHKLYEIKKEDSFKICARVLMLAERKF